MNKDERLEEMIAIIQQEHSDCMSNFCDRCEYYAMKYCGSVKKATALYNANYRKVGDDEIVVKKQAYEKFVEGFAKQEEIAHSYEQGYTELLETNHQLQDELEKTKKEKKEILQVLKDNIVNRIGSKYAVIDLTDIAQRANELGIELED